MSAIYEKLVRIYHEVEENFEGPQHFTFWLHEQDYNALRDERCGIVPQKVWNAQIRLATQKVPAGVVCVENKHPEAKKADLVGLFKLDPKRKGEARDGEPVVENAGGKDLGSRGEAAGDQLRT